MTSTFEITDKTKRRTNDRLDKNNTDAAIVIGLVDPNGAQFYGHGKMTNASNAIMNENTVFIIGSNTNVFTAILLSDMVTNSLIQLDDSIETYLHSNVTVPQYNEHKITIKDLATYTSGLSEFPDNYCTSFDPTKTPVQDSIQYHTDLFNCTKNYDFDQLYLIRIYANTI